MGVATERGEVEQKAAEWEVPAEDVVCHGCKTDVLARFCTDCVIRLCARDRGVESCGECEDYPCATIQKFEMDGFPHHTAITTNLDAIHGRGVDAWLAEQKTRWRCPACGTPFTWYVDKCPGCGAVLYDARAEEDDIAEEKSGRKDEYSIYWKMRRKLFRYR